MAKKPSYPRKEAPQPIRKKAGPTSDEDGAQKDKVTGRGLQRKMPNDPQKRHGSLRDRLGSHQPERRQRYSPRRLTPLIATVSQVLREVRNEQFLRWPSQMKSDLATRDNTKYWEFHRDYGHRTDDCIQLRKEIEYLIRRGYLRRFIAPENQSQNQA